jgi:excisionase family DNA binding protein
MSKEHRMIKNIYTIINSTGIILTYISKQEKARELKVTTRTIDRMIKRGTLQYMKMTGSKRKWFIQGGGET